ncbi:MAG: DUF1549 domain-containing protein [Saprospiraceae bacterium]|nr:DUF1549 domain-containing protein [Saprospiraceae bacterium]
MSPLAPNLDKLKKGQNEIDYFIDKSLKNASLHPTHQASKNSLIRRVSYILTGLPPATESIEKYLADDSPDAYEKMVAQYLHSIHFGEKWARHWMDIVRYAETKVMNLIIKLLVHGGIVTILLRLLMMICLFLNL